MACLSAVSAAGLEATLIAVDLSGYMLNGDYPPSRLQCQYECVSLINSVKTQNPESSVGLMSLSCTRKKCPRVYISPCLDSENHDVMSKLHFLNQRIDRRDTFVDFEGAMEVKHLGQTRGSRLRLLEPKGAGIAVRGLSHCTGAAHATAARVPLFGVCFVMVQGLVPRFRVHVGRRMQPHNPQTSVGRRMEPHNPQTS